jgi:thiol-disulfide isomerase/thioredoxin
MTFEQYLAFIATPENLKRESSPAGPRRDWSAHMRQWYQSIPLGEAQAAAWKWLAGRPGGPAKILAISEEWSSDCRRDIPMLARIADTAGMELRIFPRDGHKFGRSQQPSLAEAPDSNADLMAEFLNRKNGQTWQSIPVAVFYTKDLEYLYHYTEFPAIYHKDRVRGHMAEGRPGETKEQTEARSAREFTELQQSPFFRIWALAGVDEMISALHERLTVGPPA